MQYYHSEYKDLSQCAIIKKDTEIIDKPKPKPVKVDIYQNKWHQLLLSYPQIQITPLAQSILIKPHDTVVLREDYHDLSGNSFLLHAYYNYRQLLLLRYRETGEYYIGVPGILHDRQKRLATIFGFEGFEGGSEGSFGYYMKRVEI